MWKINVIFSPYHGLLFYNNSLHHQMAFWVLFFFFFHGTFLYLEWLFFIYISSWTLLLCKLPKGYFFFSLKWYLTPEVKADKPQSKKVSDVTNRTWACETVTPWWKHQHYTTEPPNVYNCNKRSIHPQAMCTLKHPFAHIFFLPPSDSSQGLGSFVFDWVFWNFAANHLFISYWLVSSNQHFIPYILTIYFPFSSN